VVLGGSEAMPENTRLLVSREEAWDSLVVELGAGGEFALQGIPAEAIMLNVRVRGYEISPKNQSYEALNRRVVGKIDRDITGLELLLEKRPDTVSIKLGTTPAPVARERPRVRAQDRPLRGVESREP
jgi:hypothetical protein